MCLIGAVVICPVAGTIRASRPVSATRSIGLGPGPASLNRLNAFALGNCLLFGLCGFFANVGLKLCVGRLRRHQLLHVCAEVFEELHLALGEEELVLGVGLAAGLLGVGQCAEDGFRIERNL